MTGLKFGTTAVVRWRARPLLSFALRLAIFVLPLIAAFEFDLAWMRVLPRPDGVAATLLWLIPLLLASSVVLLITRLIARRLLPLAQLLDISLAFPDVSPSRLAIARRRPRAGDLEREVNHAYLLGDSEATPDRARTVLTLALSLSAHDTRTRAHSERVRLLAELLGEKMQLIRDDRDRLRWAAILHDIGKLTIAPAILNKRGKPTEEEWAILREHPEAGARLARLMLPWLGPELARSIENHHEHFDGSGYPRGLEGEGISRLGRMLAVADSFEVMTAARPFHRPMTVRAARKELRRCSGTQFDPAVVRAFGQIRAFRLYFAIGAGSLIALVPLVKRLPASLGRAFAPVSNLAAVAVAALLVLGAIEGAGSISFTLPKQPARLLAPVRLTTPGTFTNYRAPFTTSHTLATLSDCALGLIEDRTHIYVSGCDGAISRFSLFGGTEAQAEARRLVGANSSMVLQSGHYYFALRGSGGRAHGIYTFDPDTLAPGKLVVGINNPLGMTVDPLGDSLYVVSAPDGLYRVDDPQGQPRVHLVVSGSFDGVTTSSDGSRLYVPSGETVLGFDRSGNQVLKADVCCHHPDGLIILGDGTKSGGVDVSGDIFVNDNDGTVLRIDTYHGNTVSVVASGGQRGDFMMLGIDGCLYATQGTKMVRIEPCFSTPSD